MFDLIIRNANLPDGPTTDTGDLFRYDEMGNQYIYNFNTAQLDVGTWQLQVQLDDAKDYDVDISIRD